MTGADGYGTPGGETDEVTVVRALFTAFAARDVEAVLRLVTDDVVLDVPTARAAGRPGPYGGPAGIAAYAADVERLWRDMVLQADDVRAAGGGAIVFGQMTGTFGGEEVSRRVVWTFRLRDGRAESIRTNDLGPA